MHKLVFIACMALGIPAQAQTVIGPARVVDGDTLVIEDTTVRLAGIDAPEMDQVCRLDEQDWLCGQESRTQLQSLVDGQNVICSGEETDQYGRLLGKCSANGFELGGTMVEYGWAVAFRRYSDDYIRQEFRAKSERLGIWKSQFDLPEYHRLAQSEARKPSAPRQVPSGQFGNSRTGCTIKGNRSRRGDWIYHLPGMRYYDITRPEEVFCSEAAAQAAGYRRSKV